MKILAALALCLVSAVATEVKLEFPSLRSDIRTGQRMTLPLKVRGCDSVQVWHNKEALGFLRPPYIIEFTPIPGTNRITVVTCDFRARLATNVLVLNAEK